jgi:exopolyphosphatase / guanosine-5'-triphosphate,3'-diphosphate pyrophosphatase
MMDGRGEARDDAGPFGRSLFDDPSVRALSRVGVVDVGSNSVRLVVFDGAARSPAYFYNEKIMCALGSGLAETGRLNPTGKVRALAALRRFKLLAEGMGASSLTAVATAAVREAEDGPAFREEVERETGLRLWVIDGDEEARLSAQGVLLGWPGAYGMVSDIGGSSMELAELRGGRVGRRVTSPLGPFRLAGIGGGKKGLKAHIAKLVDGLKDEMGPQRDRLFLVGGSWRAFARVDMLRRDYPLLVLHEYRMSRADVTETVDFIEDASLPDLMARTGISDARLSLVPVAALVLRELVKTFKPHDIAVSSYGIREGMLYEQMPQRLRDRDPLIEACRFAEEKDARLPGFGDQLFTFIAPLFRNLDEERTRIMRAACLLHDVSWRAHPDYRHEACFDYATRANLGGLNHRERVYIGLALLHRYKNSREGSRFEPLYRLLDPRDLKEAEVLGKAMRFGAMFSGQVADRMGALRWYPKKKVLELRLARGSEALFGEVAEARFKSLVQALGAEPAVVGRR